VDQQKLLSLVERYSDYKSRYAQNIKFDSSNISKHRPRKLIVTFLLGATIEYAPLQLIQIYFETATFDNIERDVKVTLEAQLGLIGGTMGLLTGFSILSGVEIIYFAMKFFMRLRFSRIHPTVKEV
jgi:hypothetical protein